MNRIKQLFQHKQQAANAKQEKGQSIVLIALMMVAIIAFVGIAIDVGFIFARGSQLQSAIDSAALAGVVELSGWAEGSAGNAVLEAAARTKSAQFLNANNMPVSVTNSINITNNVAVSTTPLGATQYAVTVTWPVETYFLKVLGFREPINLTRSATAAVFSLADLYVSRRVEDGVVSTSTQGIFGPSSCSHMGDPFSPVGNGGAGPYTYTYRIFIPSDYAHDIVRVEIFDPDSINAATNDVTVDHTNIAINNGEPTSEAMSCTGRNADRWQPCVIDTGELDLYEDEDNEIDLDQINPFWFVRIDENRRGPDSDGRCGPPSSYTPANNTQTRYTLAYFAQDASGLIQDVPLVTYMGQTGDNNRDTGDHQTDLHWVSPGADVPFSIDPNGPPPPNVAVPAIAQQSWVTGFEINLNTQVPNIVVDQTTGARYLYLYVQAMSGFSENGFELWAGPPIHDVPSEVNARNLYTLNNPGSHSSEGVTVFGVGNLPMNSLYSNPVDIPLIYIGPEMAGQEIAVSMFDIDSGAKAPVVFYFDSIAFTPDDDNPLGYDPDFTDWAMSFLVEGQDDPDNVPDGTRCKPTAAEPNDCDNDWITPAFSIKIPGEIEACDYSNPTMEDCTPFFGGRLVVRYSGGPYDTYGWQIRVEGLPYLVK
ncbi:pilus assembly protein TadG-related protein [Candidatus Leptofilum sp.]|uniref:pilus assembly protein TadG-related protein n=1 Tax=Candidatus Leptofilum sp. TaxID=3241576 RepID=UPI003B5BB546